MDNELVGLVDKDRCSQKEWEGLFQNKAWAEFIDTMAVRLKLTRDELEQEEGNEIHRLQGDTRTLRFILNFQSLIEMEFRQQEEEKKDE